MITETFAKGIVESIKETNVAMGSRSNTRGAENADYWETVTDQRLAQMTLNKMLDRLTEIHLLQRGQKSGDAHVVTSAAPQALVTAHRPSPSTKKTIRSSWWCP